MTLSDFLLPSENIEFMSDDEVIYGEKKYKIIVTDRRLILYSRRGLLFRSDDMVSKKRASITELQYKERGFLFGSATISIMTDVKFDLTGPPSKMKPLFQLLQSTLGK